MTDSNNKPSKKRRIIQASVLLFLLVLLPAISWIYMRSGYTWRKEALEELRDHGKIRAVHMIYPGNDKVNRLESKVCVLYFFGENPDLTPAYRRVLDTGHQLHNQFGATNNFRFVVIKKGGTPAFRTHLQTQPSIDYATWVQSGALGSWSTILMNGYEKFCLEEGIRGDASYYALADTSGTIRRFYNALDEAEVGRMVEHIAILLPQE